MKDLDKYSYDNTPELNALIFEEIALKEKYDQETDRNKSKELMVEIEKKKIEIREELNRLIFDK